MPSRRRPRSQRVRSCRSRGMSEPSASSRDARRASVSSISASSPLISADSGSRACSHRVNRMASSLSETSYRSRPAVLRWPSVNTTYEHLGDRDHAVRQLAGGERGERGVEPAQPGLGPADPLGHRGFGDEERPRDLGGGQTADGAQGEGDLAGPGQLGVTAQQQQRDRVVDDSCPVDLVRAGGDHLVGRGPQLVGALALGPGPLGPHLVDQPTGSHGGQPRVRAVGDALRRPLLVRRQQGLLQRVLGGAEVAVPPHQGREDLWRVGPPQVLGELVRAHRGELTGRRRPPTSPAAARRCRRVGRSGPRSPRPAPGWRSRSGRSRPAAPWSPRTGPR